MIENKQYTALIIDDHPLISEAYKSAFNHISKQNESISFDISVAHNCDTAYELICHHAVNNEKIDVLFF